MNEIFARITTCLLLVISFPAFSHEYYLVACAIFQDEAFFLKEWLEYHRLIGIEHFYLFNNQSTDDYLSILDPYIKAEIVELNDWDVKTNNQAEYLELLQKPAYLHALELVKDHTKWAAFIDIDEFLVPKHHENMQDFLREYEEYGGIAINWQIFGTAGLTKLPEHGLLTEHLIKKGDPLSSLNQFIKYIVQPKFVTYIHDPHDFIFQEGVFAIDSDRKPLPKRARGQPVILDKICINHYWFGTLDWFLNHKIPRREKWGIRFPKEHLEEIIASYNKVEDVSIQRFVPILKRAMEAKTP